MATRQDDGVGALVGLRLQRVKLAVGAERRQPPFKSHVTCWALPIQDHVLFPFPCVVACAIAHCFSQARASETSFCLLHLVSSTIFDDHHGLSVIRTRLPLHPRNVVWAPKAHFPLLSSFRLSFSSRGSTPTTADNVTYLCTGPTSA